MKKIATALQMHPEITQLQVWPEWFLDAYNEGYNRTLIDLIRNKLSGRSVLIGVMASNGTNQTNGAIIIDEKDLRFVTERQPMPFIMWKPGFKGHFPSHWEENAIVQIGKRRVLLLFCSEELSPLWSWWQLAFNRPDNLIVLASHRWAARDGIERFTALHSVSSSLLFGVPINRAVQLAPSPNFQ